MRKLLILTLILFSYSNQVLSAQPSIPAYIKVYAGIYALDPVLLYAIARVESNHKATAMNRNDGNERDKRHGIIKKSYGLFQIQLSTARQYGFSADPKLLLNPQVNSLFAARHLNRLYKRYRDTAQVLSAYNAGHFTHKNKSYVDKVIKYYILYKIDGRYE